MRVRIPLHIVLNVNNDEELEASVADIAESLVGGYEDDVEDVTFNLAEASCIGDEPLKLQATTALELRVDELTDRLWLLLEESGDPSGFCVSRECGGCREGDLPCNGYRADELKRVEESRKQHKGLVTALNQIADYIAWQGCVNEECARTWGGAAGAGGGSELRQIRKIAQEALDQLE